MKKGLSIFLSAAVLWILTFQTSCIGTFKLTKTYWDWNSGIGKWPGAIFFFFLGGIITGVTLMVDIIILNLIEFWTGSNPMSMNEGDKEQQMVMAKDGNMYEITATKNRFDIIQMTGNGAGTTQSMIYNAETKTWLHEKDCEVNKILQYSENGSFVSVYAADGRVARIPSNIENKEIAVQMMKKQFESQLCVN